MSAQVYEDIRTTKYATFVKLCDRIANMRYSYANGSSMYAKYKAEYQHFKEELFCEEYREMFEYIDRNLMF